MGRQIRQDKHGSIFQPQKPGSNRIVAPTVRSVPQNRLTCLEIAACIQRLEHDERINKTYGGVTKGSRQRANDCKAISFPQLNGSLIGGHNQVVLHGSKAKLNRGLLRVLTHQRGNTLPLMRRINDVPTVADVRP